MEGSLGGVMPRFLITQRQTDKVIKIWLASFLWVAWVRCKTVSNPKSPKKHDTVYHFGPSQMVLKLITIRQSFPNDLISIISKRKTLVETRNFYDPLTKISLFN